MADDNRAEDLEVSEDIFDKVAEDLGEDPAALATAEVADEEGAKQGQKPQETEQEKPARRKKSKKTSDNSEGSEESDSEISARADSGATLTDEVESVEDEVEAAQEEGEEQEKKEKTRPKKKGQPTPPNPAKAKRKKYDKSEAAKLHGKRYAEAAAKVEPEKEYEFSEAIALVRATSSTKFDASAEAHLRLGVDPKYQDQQLRATVSLPHGTGKSLRVAVIAGIDGQQEAKKAGADLVGEDDLIKKIEGGELDFDVLVSTPEAMGKIGRLGKILGTKGLMPNPKAGTVTPDVGKAVTEIKSGRVEFRVDKDGNLHQSFGKVSFSEKDLEENLRAFLSSVVQNKPSGVKGTYVKAIYLSTTMGPSITLDTQKALSNLS
jgi:large subunit ribosomal protein L1